MLDTLYLVGASFEGIAAHARESDSTIVDFFSNWIFLRGTLDTLPDAKAALIGTISVVYVNHQYLLCYLWGEGGVHPSHGT